MDRFGVPRHATHYNIVLTCFASASRFQEMSKYLTDMRAEKIPPNAWTYSALLTGFALANDLDKSVEIFRLAKGAKQLTVAIATQMLDLLLKHDRVEPAFDILKQMHELYVGQYCEMSDTLEAN
jgi:pentatricopeptide repeat protein